MKRDAKFITNTILRVIAATLAGLFAGCILGTQERPVGSFRYVFPESPEELFEQALGFIFGYFVVVGVCVWYAYLSRPAPERHQCKSCSYNLTGNVSGRCPECGAEIATEDA